MNFLMSQGRPRGHFNFLAGDPFHKLDSCFVGAWFWYAVAAAILCGAHQIFTKLAADHRQLGRIVVLSHGRMSILFISRFFG
jgi:hypothetical protein